MKTTLALHWMSYLANIIIFCLPHVQCSLQTTVTISHGGSLLGVKETVSIQTGIQEVHKFLGIPYAVPPVGDKRFAPPERHPGWTGTRSATTLPPACWQYLFGEFDQNNKAAKMWVNNTEMSEDCLYLNVWSPAKLLSTDQPKLPVMVWIYGGGYTTGTSTLDVYDGSILAATQNVVVVSMQYRLGAFGFLRLDPGAGLNRNGNSKTLANVALGNQGLLDNLLALQWTNENIKYFGGDSREVTVFGESAGAVSSSILWLSPLAHSYFKRVIMQSSSVYARWALYDLDEAHSRGNEYAMASKCKSPSIDRDASVRCLQNRNPIDLVNNLSPMFDAICERRRRKLKNLFGVRTKSHEEGLFSWVTSSCLYFDTPLRPVVDGYLLPQSPEKMFAELYSGTGRKAPELLLGVNKNEGMFFLLYGLQMKNASFLDPKGTVILPETVKRAGERNPLIPEGFLADFHQITAAQILSEEHLVSGISHQPALFYGLPTRTNSSTGYADPNEIRLSAESIMARLDSLTGDMEFICPTLNFAEKASRIPGAKVFLYRFVKRTASWPLPTWTGVMHGYEIEYVFGMPRSQKFQQNFYSFTAEEMKLSDMIMQMWANFAKSGTPGNGWPVFKSILSRNISANDHLILDIVLQPSMDLDYRGCQFWLHQIPHMLNNHHKTDVSVATGGCTSRGDQDRLKPQFYILLYLLQVTGSSLNS